MISKKFIQDYCLLSSPPGTTEEISNAYIDATIDLLDNFIESSNMAIIAIDRKRKIVCANTLAARFLKRPQREIVDQFSFNVLPASSPLTKANIKHYEALPMEFEANGRKVWAERSPILIRGKVWAVISYFRDATDDINRTANSSQRLRNTILNESFFNDILENSYDGIYITDVNGRTVLVNKAYEKLSGMKRSELIGKNIRDLQISGHVSTSITDQVVSGKETVTKTQTLKNGTEVLITGTPCFDSKGNVKHVITNVRDVSELASLSAKLAAEQSRTEYFQQQMMDEFKDANIVSASKAFNGVLHLAAKMSKMDSTVLLLGETGTGKEVVAQHIHNCSGRAGKPYIKINCGAIPANLLESELFGYAPGAFTGANSKGKPGLFELADNGTLFLDEIGELPIALQSALLRVLQDGEVTRVGDVKSHRVDVRIIAATNRNLTEMIEEGTFRSDLYYRLNVVSISIPPLRERLEDIQPLAEKTLNDLVAKYGIEKVFSPQFIESLKKQSWPGNIRELKNYIERQFVLTEGKIINSPASLFTEETTEEAPSKAPVQYTDIDESIELPTYAEAKEQMERVLFSKAMELGGSTYKAAELLKMSQPTFYRKYKELFPSKP